MIRDLVFNNSPVHAVFYVSGVLQWAVLLGLGIYFAIVGAVHVLRVLFSAWLTEEPKQLRFPTRGL